MSFENGRHPTLALTADTQTPAQPPANARSTYDVRLDALCLSPDFSRSSPSSPRISGLSSARLCRRAIDADSSAESSGCRLKQKKSRNGSRRLSVSVELA